MKYLPNIPINKYNDFEFNYNFLQSINKIGNEELDINNNFHCFWKGPFLKLHLVSIKSILATQSNPIIYIWVADLLQFNSSPYIKELKALNVKIKTVDENIFKEAGYPQLYEKYTKHIQFDWNKSKYNSNIAYASDIFRFIVLKVHGGIWFDLDVLFLKDLNNIKLNRFVYKWGVQEYGNGAIMRLEKNNDIIEKILSLNINKPFYPTTTFVKENNLNIWMLPTEFFDIIWKYKKYNGEKISLPIKNFAEFFEPTNKLLNIKNFLPGCFTYHWHNQWNKYLIKNSPIEQIYNAFNI